MGKATFTAQPVIHTPSLSLLQSRCILFIYPDTVAQFSPEWGKLNQALWNRYTFRPSFRPLNCHCWPAIYETQQNKCNARGAEQEKKKPEDVAEIAAHGVGCTG